MKKLNPVIKTALVSVYDKTGIVRLTKVLRDYGVKILSTGGTAKILRDAGIPVVDVSDYTGYPEILDGRVKTLHPKIHGGLLYIRGNTRHEETAHKHGIEPIDMVIVNLYPFEKTVAKPRVTLEEAVEQIDIGGPAMLRSGAKNYESVAVVPDPKHYDELFVNMTRNDGSTSLSFRMEMAKEVFATTSNYDAAIYRYLCQQD